MTQHIGLKLQGAGLQNDIWLLSGLIFRHTNSANYRMAEEIDPYPNQNYPRDIYDKIMDSLSTLHERVPHKLDASHKADIILQHMVDLKGGQIEMAGDLRQLKESRLTVLSKVADMHNMVRRQNYFIYTVCILFTVTLFLTMLDVFDVIK